MKSTISDLWNGNLAPIRTFREHAPELQALEQQAQHRLDALAEELPEPLQKSLESYNNSLTDYMVVLTERAFCDGFSLGLKLLSEAFFDQDTPT